MAATRQYRRNSRGRFAGATTGTVITTGRAGGFASAAHRANVSNKRTAAAHRRALVRKGVKVGVAVGVGIGLAAATRRGRF